MLSVNDTTIFILHMMNITFNNPQWQSVSRCSYDYNQSMYKTVYGVLAKCFFFAALRIMDSISKDL